MFALGLSRDRREGSSRSTLFRRPDVQQKGETAARGVWPSHPSASAL